MNVVKVSAKVARIVEVLDGKKGTKGVLEPDDVGTQNPGNAVIDERLVIDLLDADIEEHRIAAVHLAEDIHPLYQRPHGAPREVVRSHDGPGGELTRRFTQDAGRNRDDIAVG